MPVKLASQDYVDWLDPTLRTVEQVNALLRPFRSEEMEAYPVSQVVNRPRHDRPECVMPITRDGKSVKVFPVKWYSSIVILAPMT